MSLSSSSDDRHAAESRRSPRPTLSSVLFHANFSKAFAESFAFSARQRQK